MASSHRAFVRKRTIWLFVGLSLLYVAVAGRLVYVQYYHSHQFRELAGKIRFRNISIPASRGGIYDRGGRPLAVSIQTASVFANRNEVKDPSKTAVRVAALLGGQAEDLEAKLNGGRTIVWLGRQVDPRLGDQVKKLRSELPGLGVESDTKRVYPAGSLAAHILGFTNIDNKGVEGQECVMDGVLRGRDGLMLAELDARRRVIPETRHIARGPENGKDVYLTIDMTIQHIAEQAIAKMTETFKPQSACAVVMDPRTGEILALANYPVFDPNKPRAVPASKWRNRAVADLYEPGSTLKVVTVSAGLNEGLSSHAAFAQCTGREKMKGGAIPCSLHHPFEAGHGVADMYKIIRYSCNIGAAHIALRLGPEKLRHYEEAFGLVSKPKAGFGCEAVGYLTPAGDWIPIQLANIGFGQGIAVTPLQMAGVYATVANGGEYVPPRVVREIRSAGGSIYKEFQPGAGRRVISKSAAREMTKMLMSCVTDGTGKAAQITGRTVAGKTGSAQIANPNGGGYMSGVFVASFMGFAPANKPRLVIAVVVNRPQGSHWGATVAAPVFKEIGEKALWYLKVPADAPLPAPKRKPTPDGKGLA